MPLLLVQVTVWGFVDHIQTCSHNHRDILHLFQTPFITNLHTRYTVKFLYSYAAVDKILVDSESMVQSATDDDRKPKGNVKSSFLRS